MATAYTALVLSAWSVGYGHQNGECIFVFDFGGQRLTFALPKDEAIKMGTTIIEQYKSPPPANLS